MSDDDEEAEYIIMRQTTTVTVKEKWKCFNPHPSTKLSVGEIHSNN